MKYSEFCKAYNTIRSKAEVWLQELDEALCGVTVEALDFDTDYVTAIYRETDIWGSEEIPLCELFDFEV